MVFRKKISFDVSGKPPRKSNWGKDVSQVIKLREEALNARKKAGLSNCFDRPVKLTLIVFAPNISDMSYKQSGDDDPNRYIGDLDSLVAGVCEYLQPAPKTNPELDLSQLDGKKEIGPHIALIVKNDSQIKKIDAKKIVNETLHYHVEIQPI